MKTSDFDYELDPKLIAQIPIEPRDRSRLMVVSRTEGRLQHCFFCDIDSFLEPGDVLVFNDSRVIPARLHGRKESGGVVELLLIRRVEGNVWETLVRPGRRVRVGDRIEITADDGDSTYGEVLGMGEGGARILQFSDDAMLEKRGQVPLPPYIRVPASDPERYQTVYAREKGSVAAPTAGLHFTPELLQRLDEKGVEFVFVTLHVGLDSFRPVRVEDPGSHPMHKEYGEVTEEAARRLNLARVEGRRVICVGTTTVRLLEEVAMVGGESGRLEPFNGWTRLFIMPGFRFRVADALITNFHLPRSTLLMLVTAFAGKDVIDPCYREAISQDYRFYSFGDAMLIM